MAYNPVTMQPILPAPGAFTESELNYKDEEPPRLFPDNQNSNWGLLRRIYSDQVQNVRDQIDILYTERFVTNANVLLTTWENEVGLPPNPPLLTIAQRRSNILNRLRIGPFTRERRKNVVESFFLATFGQPLQFLPPGIDLSSAAFYSEYTGAPSTLYRIYEDVLNFTYTVVIVNTSTPDIASMTRELTRITPAGISFTIDNSQAQILNYGRAVKNLGVITHWRMGANADSGPYGYTLTPSGAPGVAAAPGLLAAALPDANPASTFNGTTQWFSATTPVLDKAQHFAVGAKVRATALQPAGYNMVFGDGNNCYLGIASGIPSFAVQLDGTRLTVNAPSPLALNTTYSLLGSWDGDYLRIYVDGLEVARTPYTGEGVLYLSPAKSVGAWTSFSFLWQGTLDEVFTIDRAPSAAEVLELHNTSKGIL